MHRAYGNASRVCLALSLLTFLAPRASSAGESYADVLIKDVPHVRQKPDFCGEACAAMHLQKIGHKVDQDFVFNQSGLDPAQGRGCWTKELAAALRKINIDPGTVWFAFDSKKAAGEIEAQWKALHADLVAGVPSIVCMHYDGKDKSPEHFRLVLGYDAKKDEVIYHEPAVDDGAYRRIARKDFLDWWPLKPSADRWTVIRLALRGEKLKIDPLKDKTVRTAADFAQHVMTLKKKVPEGFTVVVQPPFVVIGDEKPADVRERSARTVKWSVDRLKAQYFTKDPDDIIDVWLFKDKTSYQKYAKEIFNDTPTTPFGYYSSVHKALIMNIATGGGTLVHEIVHPFVAANWHGCPPWLNEGMGSLYEACGEGGDGKIVGYTNWRLPGLQKAIKDDKVPAFKDLFAADTDKFYNEDRGTNYGQSRYLLYYLQEKGLLHKFYHDFYDNREKDPTGFDTLKKVLNVDDVPKFQKEWQDWVLTLRFPAR
jgi:hypothetical protein